MHGSGRRPDTGRHARTRGPAGRGLVGIGLLLAGSGAAVLLWPAAAVTADVGTVLARPTAAAPLLPTSLTAPSPSPVDRSFVPSRLVLAGVGIAAPLVATSVDDDGALVPPDDPAELGWWRGVRPRAGAGSVVVAGHLDSRRYGRGPLGALVELAPGARAVVSGADGSSATYVLRGVQTFAKESLPASELFGHDGPERLVLVTCGGTFDPRRGGWDSNVVAVLDPVTG